MSELSDADFMALSEIWSTFVARWHERDTSAPAVIQRTRQAALRYLCDATTAMEAELLIWPEERDA